MAKRIVTNQKTGQQGVFDDSTGEVTPLSDSQKIVTHKSGVKGIFDERSGEVSPIEGLTDLPKPAAPSIEPKKKDVTESAGANPLLGGRVITGFGSLNTGETGAEKAIGQMVTHPVETLKGMGKGAWDFSVEAFAGLSKFVQAGGSAGVGAPSQFIAAHEKGITATGEKTYKQRLETAEQMQKSGLDKITFGAPEGQSAQIVTYDKKKDDMSMRAPDAEAFGYEAGKGIAQIAGMAFGGVMGMGASFFSSLENNYNEARKEGIPADRAFGESAIRAGAETASDKYIGISSMIEKAMAKGVGKAAINQLLSGEITKEAFGKLVAGQGMNLSKEGLKNIGKGFIAEGGEEFAQEYMDEGIKKLFNYYQTKKSENDPNAKVEMYETKDILSKELLTGALNSGVYGGIIGSMGGVFLNSKDFHPTVYSSLQNAYDDSGMDGLARAKANIIKGVDKAITDKKYGAEQRETVLANLDLMEKNITSFQQKSGVDELTRYQKFDLENYSIPNNTASLSTYLATALNDDVVPNQGDVDKDIEDGLVTELPFNHIANVPDAFLPYVEKSKVFQGEGDQSVVAVVPNTVKAAFDQNQQTRSEFGQAVNEAMNKVLGGSTTASYESVLYAGRQLFQDKSKQDAFEMELAQHEPAIKKRIQWSNYLHGLKKDVEKTGQPFDIPARNQALKNINNFSEGQRVLHNGVENTIESISPDGQKARMANFEGDVSINDLQKIEAPTEMPAPAATEGEPQAEAAPVTEEAPKKAPADIRLTPIVSVANDGKAYEYQGQIGTFSQDDQGRVTFESPRKIYDLGNVNDPDFNQKTLGTYGFQAPPTGITVNDNNTLEIDGKKYTNKAVNPTKAITYDEKGEAISIRLYNEKGEVRTFRGIRAQTIDFKYKLKDFGNTASDIEIQSAIDEATAAIETQQSTGETTVATEDKPVEQAQQVEELPSSDRVETLVEKIKSSTGKMITAIDAAINAATNSLRDAGITVEMFDTTAEFNKAVGITGNKIPQGIFLSESGKIYLNREAMQSGWETTVVWHEATHPIINIIRNTDRKLYDSVVSGILKLAETNPQFKAVSEFVNKEYTSEESIPDEILVESIARIASGKIVFNTLPTTLKEKLIDLINKMAKALGMKENLISVSNEKAFKDLANKIVQTLKQGESIAKVVGEKNVKNFQLDQPSGFVDENGNDLTNRQMQFSLQNNYTDAENGLTYFYVKDTKEFEDLKASGNITENKVLSDFNGDHIFLHQPDAAFSGKILKNGQLLVKGNGGIFYPINFHKDGYFWASTSTAAQSMANQLNENARLNGGRVLMALTSAPSKKMFSSTTMASAVLDLFRSKVVDDTFGLDENTVRLAILDALKTETVKKAKGKEDEIIFLRQGEVKLFDVLPTDASLSEVVSLIKQSLAPDQSTFKERSTFIDLVLDRIAKSIKGSDAEQKLGEFFHKGLENKYFKGYRGGKYNLMKATLSQSISYMLSEPLLRTEEKLGEPLGGKVYAMLEMQVKGYKENHAKELKTTTFGNSIGSDKSFSYKRMIGKLVKRKNGDIYFEKGSKAEDKFKIGNVSNIENTLTKDLNVFPLTDAVKSIKTTSHDSYPESIAKFDNESNIILHILQDRQMWSDHFQDFATKKIVEYGRQKSVFPTSGVSSGSLVLDTQKAQMSQGNRNTPSETREDYKEENKLRQVFNNISEFDAKKHQLDLNTDGLSLRVHSLDRGSFPVGSLDIYKGEKQIGALSFTFAKDWYEERGIKMNPKDPNQNDRLYEEINEKDVILSNGVTNAITIFDKANRKKGIGTKVYLGIAKYLQSDYFTRGKFDNARLISSPQYSQSADSFFLWDSLYKKGLAKIIGNTAYTNENVDELTSPEDIEYLKKKNGERQLYIGEDLGMLNNGKPNGQIYNGNIYALDIKKGQMSQGNREVNSYETTLEDAGLTDKEIQDWKNKNRLKKEKTTVPSVVDAAEKLWQGEITYEQFAEIEKRDQPIKPFKEVPALPSIKEIIGALDSNKLNKGILTLNAYIPDGQYVSSRLDIPSYRGFGVYTATIHDTGSGAKVLAYGQTAVLRNVSFNANPALSLMIARGAVAKSPFAKISGNWVNEDPEVTRARAIKAMKDPSYVQAGFNPARHSHFYDKATGAPIISGDEMIQVGALVLVKDPVFTDISDPRFTTKNAKGEPIQFSQGDRLSQADEFVRNNKDEYTPEELSLAIQQGFGYDKNQADAVVSEALRNPSTPSLTMVYDSKMVDENAPMNQELGLENDIIQGSREAVDKHLQEQEQKDKMTIAGIMEALVDDKWDIRKAIEKYSGKKGFTSALLRTISGINAAIDLRLKKSMDEIYNGLNEVGEANLDRLIFSYRVIQLFERQNKKRDKYFRDSFKKAVDDAFKANKVVPSAEELNALTEKFKKEAREKYPDMASGVTTWDGKPDTVVTVQMAYDTVAAMEKKLGTAEVGGFKDLERRAMAYKRFANESLKDAHRAGMISDEVYEDYKDDFYSYRVTVDRLFESMSNEDQQINRRTMEKAFGTLSKEGTQNAIMTSSRVSMGLSYAMMHKAIKRNELKKSIYDDTVAKGLGGDLFKPANFLISKKTGEILTDEKGDQVGSADSGFTHIGIKVDGRNTYYQMKTSLFNQMEGLNKTFENPSVAEKFLQGLGNVSNRTLTAFATRYNPLFFDSNIPMDLGQQIIFTDIWDKGKTYTNLISSSFRAISRTAQFVDPLGRNKEKIQEVMEDWIAFGGSQDLMSLSKEMRNEFTSDGSVTLHGDPKQKTFFRKFKDGVSYFNAKTEVAMRLAAFNEVRNNMLEDYAKENGKQKPSENEMYKINTIAAAQSRAYTDFAQKGTYLPKWNMAYLNSSVQAFAATIEYAADNPKALAFKFAQMGAAGFSFQLGIMSAMALFGAGGMDDVTEYEKDRNILIPLFYTVGKDKFGNPKNIWHFKKIRVNPSIVPFWIATRKSAELAFNAINGIEKKPMTAGQMVDGTIDAMNEALPLAIPMVGFAEPKMTQRIGQLLSRKLMISAIYKAEFGVDVYRDRDLRSYDDVQGVLSAEGIDNKSVPYMYKFVGKTVGLSPLRTQAFAETFITSPTTNILTGLAYSAASDIANAIIPASTKTERGEYSISDPARALSALGKKSFTKSNPDLAYNTEMNEKYKMQAQLLKEANTKDRLMKIDLEELKSQSANSDEFFQKATTEYISKIDEKDMEKRMSAYNMIGQMMAKGVKKQIFSEKSYMDAIILKNSGDAVGRAKMMEYMYGDNLETAKEMITYSSTLGLPAEEVYFALEEYKKLIKK